MLKDKSEIKAILFDLDDTLLNSRKAQDNAIIQFKKRYNEFNDIDGMDFLKKWNQLLRELREQHSRGEISSKEIPILRTKQLFSYAQIDISYREAKEKYEEYLTIYRQNWMLFEDTNYVLDRLMDKYILCIISNGDGKRQREKIIDTGLDKYFNNIIISSEIGFAKPRKEIFEAACNMIKIEPSNCIMIGDKYKADIQGSIGAGIQAIWVNRKNEEYSYEPQVKHLKDILEII